MSIEAISWALRQKTGSPTLKGVLVAVANYADEHGKCWPSQKKLSELTELTDRAVRKSLVLLEEKGYLTRRDRFEEGRRISDMFSLNLHRNDVPLVESTEHDSGRTERHDVTSGTSRPKPAEPRSDKPSLEPSKNPLSREARKKIGIEDFRLDHEAVAVAKGLGLSDEQVDQCESRFRSYNATQAPQTFAQWNIHWETWCEKFAAKYGLKPATNTSTEVIREGVMLSQTDPDYEAWEQYHGRKLPAGKSGTRWFPSRKPPAKEAAE